MNFTKLIARTEARIFVMHSGSKFTGPKVADRVTAIASIARRGFGVFTLHNIRLHVLSQKEESK